VTDSPASSIEVPERTGSQEPAGTSTWPPTGSRGATTGKIGWFAPLGAPGSRRSAENPERPNRPWMCFADPEGTTSSASLLSDRRARRHRLLPCNCWPARPTTEVAGFPPGPPGHATFFGNWFASPPARPHANIQLPKPFAKRADRTQLRISFLYALPCSITRNNRQPDLTPFFHGTAQSGPLPGGWVAAAVTTPPNRKCPPGLSPPSPSPAHPKSDARRVINVRQATIALLSSASGGIRRAHPRRASAVERKPRPLLFARRALSRRGPRCSRPRLLKRGRSAR